MAFNPFTDEEKATMRKHYYNIGAIGVAKLLPGRSRDVIKQWAYNNGLKVSKEYRTKTAIRANKSWIRSEETKKKIGDGHRKHPVFRCEVCNKQVSYYRKLCWDCYLNQCSGSGNGNWRGGITSLNMFVRVALWDVWNLPIFRRDNFTCQTCGDKRGGNLVAHHVRSYKKIRDMIIKKNNKINIKKFDGKKIMADLIIAEHKLQDGITLCKTCHIKIHRKKPNELLETPNVKSRAISSQAMKGEGFMEGSTTRRVSPNNNLAHERSAYH